MYKVLLVDDEQIILEGVSQIVDWESAGAELCGALPNGAEAYRQIFRDPPDIVISDIRMPGMDGLELVRRTAETHPRIRFILLSGYNDFEYARSAMKYGVRHYLLKPCNEHQILGALREVIDELKSEDSREQFLRSVRERLDRTLPYVKEQFLREWLTNRTYGMREWDDFRKWTGLSPELRRVRVLLFVPEGEAEFEHLFALRNIAEEWLGPNMFKLSASIGHQVVLLTEDAEDHELFARVIDIKSTFSRYYRLDATAAISRPGEVTEARRLYREALDSLRLRFHLGEGSVITAADVQALGVGSDAGGPSAEELAVDGQALSLAVQSGDWDATKAILDRFFDQAAASKRDRAVVKAHCVELYVALARLDDESKLAGHLRRLAELERLDTVSQLRAFVEKAAREIVRGHYEKTRCRHSSIVARVLDVIREQLGNPDLSLGWVAREIVYLNADYLGKLFKRETGENFTKYVTRLRVERAKELILAPEEPKMFEVAEAVGFGHQPHYFSHVFKKLTGFSPSEYRARFRAPSQSDF